MTNDVMFNIPNGGLPREACAWCKSCLCPHSGFFTMKVDDSLCKRYKELE